MLMKNLLTTLTWMLLSTLILSSCSPSWTFSKRRYTKGYYISHSAKANKPEEKTVRPYQQALAAKSAVPQSPAAESQHEPLLVADAATAPSAHENTQKTNPVKLHGQPLLPAAKKTIAEQLKPLDNAIKQHQLTAGDDDGLSLFWIVILVILILWALGLISGNFGAIVNVLLVIALILLILWLLRIL